MPAIRDGELFADVHRPGDLLADGYVVLAHLHRGGRLDIYDLWSEERACRCVGKALRPDARDDDAARRGLLREGRRLQRLTHPHIVRAYAVLDDPTPLVILETLPGETLERLIERAGPLSAPELAYLGLHLGSALTYLHRQRLLHLDLTPGNVVASHGIAKVIDLSLSRRPGQSRGGDGTRGFNAPELAEGAALTPATDIYGLGATLVFSALGDVPADAANGTLAARVEAMMSRDAGAAARAIAATITACLERTPARRPSLDELTAALSAIIRQAESGGR